MQEQIGYIEYDLFIIYHELAHYTFAELDDDDDSALEITRKLFQEYKMAIKTNMDSLGMRSHWTNSNAKVTMSFDEFKKLKMIEVP